MRKVLLGIGGVLFALILAWLLSANAIVRQMLIAKVNRAIANTNTMLVQYGELDLNIYTGEIALSDVVFQTDTLLNDSLREYSRMEVSKANLDGVNYFSLFLHREIDLTGITIEGVRYRGILDTKAMEAWAAADVVNAATKAQFEKLLHEAQKYLKRVTLQRLTVNNASAFITALETGLDIKAGDVGMEFYDLGYSLVDSIPFHFNDSVMKIDISCLDMVMPDSLMNLQLDRLYTEQDSRSMVLTGIKFATTPWGLDPDGRPISYAPAPKNYYEMRIDTVRLDSINLPDMREKRSFIVGVMHVMNGRYIARVDDSKRTEKLEDIDFAALRDTTSESQLLAQLLQIQYEAMSEFQKKILKQVQNWLDEAIIGRISVENSSANVASIKSEFEVDVKDINVSVNDIAYDLTEEIPYDFNDSIYSIAVGPVRVVSPDGLLMINSNGLWHRDCGPVCLGKTTVKSTVDKWQLSHALGNKIATWIDMTIDTLYTSDLSPFSTVIGRKLQLNNVYVRVSKLNLFVDNRILPAPEFEMPSKQTLLEIKRLFDIDNFNLAMDELKIEITGQFSNNGIIHAKDATVSFNDIFVNLDVDQFDALFPDGTMRLSIGNIHTTLPEHNIVVEDVLFSNRDEKKGSDDEPYHKVKVDYIVVGRIVLDDASSSSNISASVLRIIHPQYTGKLIVGDDEASKQSDLYAACVAGLQDSQEEKMMESQQKNTLRFFQEWLDYAQMKKIQIEKAGIDITSINSGFSLKVRDYDLSLSGIGFNIGDFIPMDKDDSLLNLQYFLGNFRLLGNSAITNLAFRDLHITMPDSTMYLEVPRAYTDRRSKSIVFNDLEFATDTVVPENEMYQKVKMDILRIDGIVLPDLHTKREAKAKDLRVIRPCYFARINEEAQADNQEKPDNSENQDPYNLKKQERAMNIARQFFDGAVLDKVLIEDASAEYSSLVSDLSVKIEGFDLSVNDVTYEMSGAVHDLEEVPGLNFNDTNYSIGFRHADILLPDSTMQISLNNFNHKNCGPVAFGRTSMYQTMDKWDFARRKGDVPTTWCNVALDTFRTSFVHPMNLFKDFKDRGKAIFDTVYAVIDTLTIFRDLRFEPKQPYVMPQKPLMSVDSALASSFSLCMLDAKVNKMDVGIALTDTCVLHLELDDLWGKIKDLSLEKGQNINIVGGGSLGSGVATVEANIGLKSDYPWDIKMDARDIDLSVLNSLTFPAIGLNLGGIVHEMRAVYGGDSLAATGLMVMKYNGLTAVFSKYSPSPYKKIGKHHKFLNSVAKTLVCHDNPKKEGKELRAYKVRWKNDVWKPTDLYMCGPLIKGVIETLLPGLFVHNKVKAESFPNP